ncbi:MAG: SagB/ThcOx family dehydrogenase [Nitrospira sp. CG24C]|jgi:SagB-type dehydrogenase family enzyme|nr:MAG: SagB/ThcOx family dehydrogenase [Nitrospira sp. CG24C]
MATEIPLYHEPIEAVPTDPIDRVIRYHVQTKHHFNRYARALGYLDWANQPDPFRRFEGAPLIALPLLTPDEDPVSPVYNAIYQHGAVACQPVTVRTLSRFFEFSLALSAWKKAGESEWPLRSNPSSGNLHPTEGYVVLPQIEGLDLKPGLYHYAPKEHGLELRAEFSIEQIARLLAPFPSGAFIFGLTSVHWREAWKYGERAFRYCNHDVGHAIGSARFAAATLGWNMALLDGMEQNTIALLLGTSRVDDFQDVEPEHPDCLAVIWPVDDVRGEALGVRGDEKVRGKELGVSGSREEIPLFLDPNVVKDVAECTWHGKANRLSGEHGVHWDIIDKVAEASWKVQSQQLIASLQDSQTQEPPHPLPLTPHALSAGQIIRQRRSAVSFDGKTSISSAAFFHMMELVMPRADRPQLDRPMPWDVWPYDPAIHLLIFVHRVDGLTPGLYFLARDPKKLAFIQQSMNPELSWTPVPGCQEDFPLYWLLEGDAKKLAIQVSCHQDIAGDSAFSFGMLAEFEGHLREGGAWWYPRLFWESGLLGQVLYLEAEAVGIRATGIGCFFDDPVHEIVAVKGLSFQSLYHFTIGGPVEDGRLMTLPPYGRLKREG